MNAWLLLVPAFVAFSFGAYISYADAVRRGPLFLPLFLSANLLTGLIWVSGARLLDDKRALLVYSVVWDVLMALAYYALPLAVLGVRPTATQAAGTVLVVLGLVLVKAGA